MLRYLITARYLRASQIIWYIVRRVLPARRGLPEVDLGAPRATFRVPRFAESVVPDVGPGELRFLNHARPLDAARMARMARMDWVAADAPKLWRYNLHYFDYLHWPVYSDETKARLIESWIAANPPGQGDAWEPYTVSLRTVNWIRFIGARGIAAVPPGWLRSLAGQCAWLERNLEFHILANHLAKNAKALVYAGVFFSCPAAQRLLAQGLRILDGQAREQFLCDGGHFERSPLYHCIVLEDYLDVLNLLAVNPGLLPAGALGDALAGMRAAVERGLGFLAAIRAADGEIPLFNDSAFGIATSPAALLAYGERVLGRPVVVSGEPRRIDCRDTGYFGYVNGGESLIVDCGPVGPDYQPGHAHCDTLSYELCVAGQRMVVDSGVYDYDTSAMRAYVRSTAAHNTVAVDGAEQSEVWGAFRVARRARPLRAELSGWQDGGLTFRGAHDGYRRLGGAPVHEREIRATLAGCWEVNDSVTGRGEHAAQSFVHLHPELAVSREGDACYVARHPSGAGIRITASPGTQFREERGYYCPRFGVRAEQVVLVMEARGALPLRLGYVIERIAAKAAPTVGAPSGAIRM